MPRKFQKIEKTKVQPSQKVEPWKFKRGFSMLEMLIAGFILSVGLIATLQLVAKSMSNSADARNHVIASSLAQEGLELVRNIRDNSVPTNPFVNFPDGTTIDDCRIQKFSAAVGSIPSSDCGAGVSKALNISSNFYVHIAGTPTKFQRKIWLEYQQEDRDPVNRDDSSTYQVKIQSTVIWGGSFPAVASCNLQNKCVMLESTLTKRN